MWLTWKYSWKPAANQWGESSWVRYEVVSWVTWYLVSFGPQRMMISWYTRISGSQHWGIRATLLGWPFHRLCQATRGSSPTSWVASQAPESHSEHKTATQERTSGWSKAAMICEWHSLTPNPNGWLIPHGLKLLKTFDDFGSPNGAPSVGSSKSHCLSAHYGAETCWNIGPGWNKQASTFASKQPSGGFKEVPQKSCCKTFPRAELCTEAPPIRHWKAHRNPLLLTTINPLYHH